MVYLLHPKQSPPALQPTRRPVVILVVVQVRLGAVHLRGRFVFQFVGQKARRQQFRDIIGQLLRAGDKGKKRGLESTPQNQSHVCHFFVSNLIPNANLLPVITAIAARARFIIIGIRCTVSPLVAIVTLPGAQAT